ncbi:hypothetical protein M513_06645 [Trichuris suis]|uniref:Uncharacterized protein n=1 Tax=Trichuris suis TaxID=68888 RepID=A0A085M5F2_9BILA|nr:hypothetical protein M513_06645 [Trichuris suis]
MTKSNGAENMSSNFLCTFFVIPGNISWGYWLSLDEYKLARLGKANTDIVAASCKQRAVKRRLISVLLKIIYANFPLKAEEALNVSHCLSFNDISFE